MKFKSTDIIEHLFFFIILIFLMARVDLTSFGYLPEINGSIFSMKLLKIQNLPISENYLSNSFGISGVPFYFIFSIIPFIVNNSYIYGLFYFIFEFFLYYILSYLLSNVFYNTFAIKNINNNTFSFIFITIMIFNPVFVYDFPGIIDWVFGIPLTFYSILKIYRIISNLDAKNSDYVKAALPPIILSFADPRYTVWFLIIMIFIMLPALINKMDFRKALKIFYYWIIISIPFYLSIYIISTIGDFTLIYVSARPLTFGDIKYFSHAYPLFMYFAFHGEFWPNIWLSPFLLGSKNLDSLKGIGGPTGLILGNNILSYIWLSLSFLPFILSFIPILRKNKYILYLYPGYIIFFLITIGTYSPRIFVNSYLILGKIPVIGGILAIAFAITTYFMQITIVYALFLTLFLISEIISYNINNKKSNKVRLIKLKKIIFNKKIVIILIILAFILPNYQLIDGSIYPNEYTPAIAGNGAPALGKLSPINPPAYWIKAYNLIESNESGNFAVGYTGPNGFAYTWDDQVSGISQPGISASGGFYQNLSEIMLLNQPYLTKTLMTMFGVRYFFIDNTSVISNYNYEHFFSESPGMVLVYEHKPELWVYEDKNASLLYSAYPVISNNTSILYNTYLLSNLSRSNIQIINSSDKNLQKLVINGNNAANMDLITGSNISPAEKIPSYYGYSNFSWNTLGCQSFYIGGKWLIADHFTDNVLGLNETGNELSVTNISGKDRPGITLQLDGFYSMIKVPLNSLNTKIYGHISIRGNNTSSIFISGYNISRGSIYSNSEKLGKNGNFSLNSPSGLSYINIGFNIAFNNTVKIGNLNISYKFLNNGYSYSMNNILYNYYQKNISNPNLTINKYYPGGSTNYILGSNWTGTSVTNGFFVNESNGILNFTSMNSNGGLKYGGLALSYKSISLPAEILGKIPNYNKTYVMVNISMNYKFIGKNFTSMSIGSSASNYSAFYNLPYSSDWKHIHETILIPPGSSQFNIQIGAGYNGSLLIKNLTGSYTFSIQKTHNIQFQRNINAELEKYYISTYIKGNGTLNINNKTININALNDTFYKVEITANNQKIKINTTGNISMSGILIIPSNEKTTNKKITGFNINDFTGTGVFYYKGSGYLLFPYDININNGKIIGKDASGFYVYKMDNSSMENKFYFKNYLILNISTILVMIAIYSFIFLIYFPFIKINIKRIIRKKF